MADLNFNPSPSVLRTATNAPTPEETDELLTPLTGGVATQFQRGLRSALTNMTAGSIASDALDADLAGDFEKANALKLQANSYAATGLRQAPRVQRISDIHGVGDTLDYISGTLGSNAPGIVPVVAGAVLGRGAGAFAKLGTAGREAASLAGGAASIYPQMYGEQALESQNTDASPEARQVEARTVGAAQAGLGAVVPTLATKALVRAPLQGTVTGLAKTAAEQAAAGAGMAKVGQLGADYLDPNRDQSNDNSNLLEAAGQGAVVGAALGTPHALLGAAGRALGDRIQAAKTAVPEKAAAPLGAVDEALGRAKTAPAEAADFFHHIFTPRDEDARSLVLGDQDPGLKGRSADETAANLEKADAERPVMAQKLFDELAPEVKKKFGETPDFTDPETQAQIGRAVQAQRMGKVAGAAIKDTISGIKDMLKGMPEPKEEEPDVKANKQAPDTTHIQGILMDNLKEDFQNDPLVHKQLPQLARSMAELSARGADIDDAALRAVGGFRGLSEIFEDPYKTLKQVDTAVGAGQFVSDKFKSSAPASQDLAGFMFKALPPEIKGRVADPKTDSRIKQLAAFIDSLANGSYKEKTASAKIDEKTGKFLGRPEVDTTPIDLLAKVYGSEATARSVLDFYHRKSGSELRYEETRKGIPDSDTDSGVGENADTTGLTEKEAPKASYTFAEERSNRPFHHSADTEKALAEARTWFGPDAEHSVVGMDQYADETGKDPHTLLKDVVRDIKSRIVEPRQGDDSRRLLNNARLQGQLAEVKATRDAVLAHPDTQGLTPGQRRHVAATAALSKFKVIKTDNGEPNPLVADDHFIREARTTLNAKGMTDDSKVVFEKTDGSKLALSAESMWKSMGDRVGSTGQELAARKLSLFKEAVAAVLARSDIKGLASDIRQTRLHREDAETVSERDAARRGSLDYRRTQPYEGARTELESDLKQEGVSKFDTLADHAAKSPDNLAEVRESIDLAREEVGKDRERVRERTAAEIKRLEPFFKVINDPKAPKNEVAKALKEVKGAKDWFAERRMERNAYAHEAEKYGDLETKLREIEKDQTSGITDIQKELVPQEEKALKATKRTYDELGGPIQGQSPALGTGPAKPVDMAAKMQKVQARERAARIRENPEILEKERKEEQRARSIARAKAEIEHAERSAATDKWLEEGTYGERKMTNSELEREFLAEKRRDQLANENYDPSSDGGAGVEHNDRLDALRFEQLRRAAENKLDPKSTDGKKLMNEQSRSGPVMSDAEAQAVRDEIHRTRGPEVQVLIDKLHKDLGASGTYEKLTAKRVINIAMDAAQPLSVAAHEAMHDFFSMLTGSKGDRLVKTTLLQAAEAPRVQMRLRELLKDEPAALKQLNSPEERLAYMYQFWQAGMLKVGTSTEGVFGKLFKFIRDTLGVVTNDERAEAILTAFHKGELADPSAVGNKVLDMNMHTIEEKAKQFSGPIGKAADAFYSSATDRLRATGLESFNKIADLFHKEPGHEEGAVTLLDGSKTTLGFLQKRQQQMNIYVNKLQTILDGTTEMQRNEARAELQSMAPKSPIAIKIRGLLDEMEDYMRSSGVKFKNQKGEYEDFGHVEDYFPRVWNDHYITQHRSEFMALMKADGVSDARAQGIYQALVGGVDSTDVAENEHHIGFTPFNRSINPRTLDFITKANAAKYAPFQDTDIVHVMTTYINQAVHRGEYARYFGNDGEVLQKLVADGAREGATPDEIRTLNKAIRALEGTLGNNIDPQMKKIFGGLIAYENMALLPFVLFSSLIDPFGLAVRSGDMKEAWNGFKEGITGIAKQIARTDKGEAWEIAKTLGLVDEQNTLETMGSVFRGNEANKVLKKVNSVFFRWNGMEMWNQRMRVAGMMAAGRFIEKHMASNSEQSQRFMRELGIDDLPKDKIVRMENGALAVTPEQLRDAGVKFRDDAEANHVSQKLSDAVFRFVDGSIMRPNAAHRPIWGSDPHWAIVFHLKQFTYSFENTILKRVRTEFLHNNVKPALILATYVPFMMAIDATKAALLGGGNKANWGIGDYIQNATATSGILGTKIFGEQVIGDAARGQVPGSSLLGPSLSHAVLAAQTLSGAHSASWHKLLLRSVPASPLVKSAFAD